MMNITSHIFDAHLDPVDKLADLIWGITDQQHASPLILVDAMGLAYDLQMALSLRKPVHVVSHLAFLPRIAHWQDWLYENAPADLPINGLSDFQKWVYVYESLGRQVWLQKLFSLQTDASRWAMAKNIIRATELLSQSLVGLGQQNAQHHYEEVLHQIFGDSGRQPIDLETKLVLTYWQGLLEQGDRFTQISELLQRNDWISNALKQPIVYVQTTPKPFRLDNLIYDFFKDLATQQQVYLVKLGYDQCSLWSECITSGSPEAQVIKNRQNYFNDLEHQSRQVLRANTFEEAAWYGAQAIQELFLKNKCKRVALIAQDRLLARRTRALLARFGSQVSIYDETGWKLSTTSAAAALMSLLEIIRSGQEGPSTFQFLDFIKNPFIAWDKFSPVVQRSEFIQAIEAELIAHKVLGSWEVLRKTFSVSEAGFSPLAMDFIDLLKGATDLSSARSRNCSQWLAQLMDVLQKLKMDESLASDLAGRQVIKALEVMNLAPDNYQFQLNEWLSLIGAILEDSNYVESTPRAEYQVSILPLSAMKFRKFDAWVMLGCDSQHLPSYTDSVLFISNRFKKVLGGLSVEDEHQIMAQELSALMQGKTPWRMIWQAKGDVQDELEPSTLLQRLYLNHPDLLRERLPWEVRKIELNPISPPEPIVREQALLPNKISPSGYKTLRECPYRYWATKLLGLKTFELDEGIDASMIGQVLHKILRDYHHRAKTLEHTRRDDCKETQELERLLFEISEAYFNPLLERNPAALSSWLQWKKNIPQWVAAQLTRESDGWSFYDAEKPIQFMLDCEGRSIEVTGFYDRLDLHSEDGLEVIDYKYSSHDAIKKRADHIMDDPQLLMYAYAINQDQTFPAQVSKCTLWSIREPAKTRDIGYSDELLERAINQVSKDMADIFNQQPLKATAPDSICQYCDVQGLCRKGMWS